MQRKSTLSLQRWGNSLAIRIPVAVARSAHFSLGQPVVLSVENNSVVIKPVGTPKLSLTQKLALFDSEKHTGEAMLAAPLGKEVFE